MQWQQRQLLVDLTSLSPNMIVVQVQKSGQVTSGAAFGNCDTFCHPKERALNQVEPQSPEYHAYIPEPVPDDLDIEE